MNILYISPNSPRESVGGIERYITNLINYYNKHPEFGVNILLPSTGQSTVEKMGCVTIFYENSFSIPRHAQKHKKEILKNARIFSSFVESILRDKKIDIIVAENIMLGPPAIYSIFLNMVASLYKIPIVLRLHSFATSSLEVELVSQLMWNKISCVSQSVTGDCFQKGTDIDTLSTQYLGVDTLQFNNDKTPQKILRKELSLDEKSKIILTACRIIGGPKNILKEKGIINLIKAFSKIYTRYPNLYLLLAIGTPPENLKTEFEGAYEMLLGYIKLHGIEKQTVIRTFKLDMMPHVYKESDVFVLSSENETFGQVFIEAMSCGVPVIGTKVGGIPEIISDSYNGFLIQPDDASILAQRIEQLLNDRRLRDSFIKSGTKTVELNFSSDKQFTHFNRLLEQVLLSEKKHFSAIS